MDLSFQKTSTFSKPSVQKSRYVSLSPTEKDYILFTRSLPSSNPIRIASPDPHTNPEKIPSTKNPFEKNPNIIHQAISQPNPLEFESFLKEMNSLRKELVEKTVENERLSRRNLNRSEILTNSPISMKESEAKLIAKKFAEDRVKAENEAQNWMKKYQELFLKIQDIEKMPLENNKNGQNPEIIKELVSELKAWEEKSKEIEKVNVEIKAELEFFRKKNVENEVNLKKFLQELELWKNKYKSFDLEVSQKIIKYEENIVLLTHGIEKSNKELISAQSFIKKQENELISLQNQLLDKEVSISQEKAKKASKIDNSQDFFLDKIVLLGGLIEDFEGKIKVWEIRCLAIETEWSNKYKELEALYRKECNEKKALQGKFNELREELELLMKKNEIYVQNMQQIQDKKHDLEENKEVLLREIQDFKQRESQLISENENVRINEEKLMKELENRDFIETNLKREIDTLYEKCRNFDKRNEETIKDYSDFIRKSQNPRESTESNRRYKAEKEALGNEILGLKSKILILQAEKDDFLSKFRQNQQFINEKDLELNAKSQEILQKDLKIVVLTESLNKESKFQEETRKEKGLMKGNKPKTRDFGIDFKELNDIMRESKEVYNDIEKTEIQAERLAYETTIIQMKGRINDLETNLANYIRDFDEYKRNFSILTREKEDFRKKLAVFENSSANNRNLQREIEDLKRENWDFKEFKLKVDIDKNSYEGQIIQLKKRIEDLKEDLEKSYRLLEERRKERDEAIRKLEENLHNSSSTEYYSRNSQYMTRNQEISKEKYDFLMKQCDEMKLAKEQYKAQAERNSEELSLKNRDFIYKLHELEDLKEKYQKSLLSLSSLESKLLEKLQTEELILS